MSYLGTRTSRGPGAIDALDGDALPLLVSAAVPEDYGRVVSPRVLKAPMQREGRGVYQEPVRIVALGAVPESAYYAVDVYVKGAGPKPRGPGGAYRRFLARVGPFPTSQQVESALSRSKYRSGLASGYWLERLRVVVAGARPGGTALVSGAVLPKPERVTPTTTAIRQPVRVTGGRTVPGVSVTTTVDLPASAAAAAASQTGGGYAPSYGGGGGGGGGAATAALDRSSLVATPGPDLDELLEAGPVQVPTKQPAPAGISRKTLIVAGVAAAGLLYYFTRRKR